ncbi:GDP-L-fucose synthetase, putative [Trypanosoma brucei gambiense DAL972]|uniref:GDP-L-fucose synthase n=1 Tax=Trypanosoma brucei gambiense (strain MHOM/CI/86/DAL972) TaxID=679716 RepID=D0A9U2_TRYB9|nr:GDP-L-fucose synthetase, putative [Trypanosoma brucei gambiense DAL972]CBH18443.1 GDP-L-fucose synthetase, putative [Trypanosoma brucei gambiense DAL972]|eukprot:XP_011780707.1 GDP-L-fucose synthetase, putative [Trypanosoma brucei gambiense DAL972]
MLSFDFFFFLLLLSCLYSIRDTLHRFVERSPCRVVGQKTMLGSLPSVVLVTGGAGLVGRAVEVVTKRNACADERWVFLSRHDADLRSMAATRCVFERHKPTHVLHLAARVGGLFKNMAAPVEMWIDNVSINNNVLECCRTYGVRKAVSCLSTCIFPERATYPIGEETLHDGPPHYSNEQYAYAKRMIDVLNRAYNKEYGCRFTSVIPTNVYGPHDNYNLQDSHVIPGLIHKFYLAKRENKPMVVMGSGRPLRQFVYSEDLAELIVWVLRHYEEVEPIILSVDECDELCIADVAKLIAQSIGFTGNIVFDPSKADGQYRKTADNAKLRRYLPDYRFTPVAEGIQRSVEWFIANYDVARK